MKRHRKTLSLCVLLTVLFTACAADVDKEEKETVGIQQSSMETTGLVDEEIKMKDPNETTYVRNTPDSRKVTRIGYQVFDVAMHSGAYLKTDDKNIAYIMLDGATGFDGVLVEIDVDSMEITNQIELEYTMGGWTTAVSSDDKVYVGTYKAGHLYQYDPETETAVDLKTPTGVESFIYGITPGKDGDIYFGTFPNCMLGKFNPKTGYRVLGTVPIKEKEEYVRTTAYAKEFDAVFAGVGSHAALMMVDELTGEVVDILPEQYKNMEFIVTLKYTGGKLMLRLNNNKGLLYDIKRENGKLVATLEQEGFNIGSNQITNIYDGKIYYSYNGYFAYYDVETQKFTATSQVSGGGGSAIDLIKLKDQEKFPGYSYVYTTTSNAERKLEIGIYNPQTGEKRSKFFETKNVPTELRSLVLGPDGRLYSNGYLIGGVGAYTIGSTEPPQQYKLIGQAENMVTVGERIYLGVYPGGSMFMFNPYKETDGKTNPLKLFSLGESEKQDRPFGMAAQDGIIYIGTLPNYGVLGGDFTIYNTKTFKWEIVKEPIKGQAITSVAANKEYAVGGTTIWGGHGINPSTTSAKLFVYDIDTKEYKVVELPQSGIPIVSGLAFDHKGRLWGTAESYLFVYDIEKNEFEYFEVAFPEKNFDNIMVVIDSTMLYNPNDRYMYGMTLRKGFFRVDPDTMEIEYISNHTGDKLTMDEKGNIYFFVKNSLYVYGDGSIPEID